MKDRIIEDWYKVSKSTRRTAPKTEKPKDEASDAQLNTQQIMEAIKRIMAGESAKKELTPRAPVLPSRPREEQIRYLPDEPKYTRLPYYPQEGQSKIVPLPSTPWDNQKKPVPLPYYPQEDEPRVSLYSNDWNNNSTPVLQQYSNTSGTGMIDNGIVAAQKVQVEKQNKPIVFLDPAVLEAERAYEKQLSKVVIDPALVEVEKWVKTLQPEIYKEGDFVDLTPGDDNKDNPYGINVDEFLRWAYSQLGYHEKASNADLDDKYANQGNRDRL